MTAHDEMHARLSRVESPNLLPPPGTIFWKRASGGEVWDEEGRRYVDFSSAFGVAALGHSHPALLDAISVQARELIHGMGDVHPPSVKLLLLERLVFLFGAPARAILSLSGTEAVESCLKTARLATGRAGVVAFEGAYHGLGYGVLGAAGRPDFREPFSDQVPAIFSFVPFPSDETSADASLELLKRHLASRRVGALLVEPIQGRGGIRVPPRGFLAAAARLAHEAGALVVFDEIMTGIGRTGRWFAFQDEGFIPDLVAVGKALGGGVPVSACIGREEVMAAWPPSTGDSIHTSTFLGHPLGCRAALAVLDVIERDSLLARVEETGRRIRASLAEVVGAARVRGRGLMIGVDCGSSEVSIPVAKRCLADGLIVLVDGMRHETIVLLPAYNLPGGIRDEGMEILGHALRTAG